MRLPRSRGTDRPGKLPDMISINVRQPGVDDRIMPGHWEGNLIKGAGNQSAVGVVVERTRRWCCWHAWKMRLLPRYAELAANTGEHDYLCDPHSPWQRST